MIQDNDFVAATAGRSFWILDDLGALQNIGVEKKSLRIFKPKDTYRIFGGSSNRFVPGLGQNPKSGVTFDYFLAKDCYNFLFLLVSFYLRLHFRCWCSCLRCCGVIALVYFSWLFCKVAVYWTLISFVIRVFGWEIFNGEHILPVNTVKLLHPCREHEKKDYHISFKIKNTIYVLVISTILRYL